MMPGCAVFAATQPAPLGELAQVVSTTATITAPCSAGSRVLFCCQKGQYLAISGQTPGQYGVLMSDHSVGFVPKEDVKVLGYQVVNADTPADADPPRETNPPAGVLGGLGQRLVQTAQQYLGVPYVWGGNTPAGIDCSGFVKAVFGTLGILLPRHSGDQARRGDAVSKDWSQWVPGDRLYFACHHPEIDHTGIYIGEGYFIHASAGHGRQVAIDPVSAFYWTKHLVCVRRSRELFASSSSS